MNIEQVEKETVSAMKGLADVLKVKTEEIRGSDVSKLVLDSINNIGCVQFLTLTNESQQAARQVFSEMLLIKFKSELALSDNTVKYLGHRVREAFVALESEIPETGSGSDSVELAFGDVKIKTT